jgi:hypothetical protein
MKSTFADLTPALLVASGEFWTSYYTTMRKLHLDSGRTLQEPIRDRNLGTTGSDHIKVFERFWRKQLAAALGVPEADVGPRNVHFRKHRSKSFDVCWPLTGDPLILISVKSMQNAYRNLTNRIEEAVGDSAVLRLYKSNAVFGFFFFILNGKVAAGKAEQGVSRRKTGAKGIAPFLELIEDGGDFFDLSDVDRYRKESSGKKRKKGRQDIIHNATQSLLEFVAPETAEQIGKKRKKGRQDTIHKAEQSLLDLAAAEPAKQGGIHYDGIAFAPTRIRRVHGKDLWEVKLSEVDGTLDPHTFLSRLLLTARLRKFIK